MKQAEVYFWDKLTGILTEDENGYTFVYSESYIANDGTPISLTMPLQTKPFTIDTASRMINSNMIFKFRLLMDDFLSL